MSRRAKAPDTNLNCPPPEGSFPAENLIKETPFGLGGLPLSGSRQAAFSKPIQEELAPLRSGGYSAGSLSCLLRAVPKLAALKQSTLLFLASQRLPAPHNQSCAQGRQLPPRWIEAEDAS